MKGNHQGMLIRTFPGIIPGKVFNLTSFSSNFRFSVVLNLTFLIVNRTDVSVAFSIDCNRYPAVKLKDPSHNPDETRNEFLPDLSFYTSMKTPEDLLFCHKKTLHFTINLSLITTGPIGLPEKSTSLPFKSAI